MTHTLSDRQPPSPPAIRINVLIARVVSGRKNPEPDAVASLDGAGQTRGRAFPCVSRWQAMNHSPWAHICERVSDARPANVDTRKTPTYTDQSSPKNGSAHIDIICMHHERIRHCVHISNAAPRSRLIIFAATKRACVCVRLRVPHT